MKVFLKVMLMVFSISAVSAWAIPPEAERMRFVPVDSSKPFSEDSKYHAWLTKMGERQVVMEENNNQLVLHEMLASAFYTYSKEKGWLPKGAEKEDTYIRSWLRANGLRSGFSTAEEFRQFVAKNGELRLLTEADLGNGNGGTTVATPVTPKAAVPAAEADAAKLTALAKQLATMQQQVESGERTKKSMEGRIAASEGRLSTMHSKSTAVQASVEELKAGFKAFRNDGFTKQDADALKRSVGGHLNNLVKQVAGVEKGLSDLTEKVNSMEMVSPPILFEAVYYTFGAEAAESYADNRGWWYSFFALLFVGVVFVIPQSLQRITNRKVQARFVNHNDRIKVLESHVLGDKEEGYSGLVEDTNRLKGRQVRMDKEVSDLAEQVVGQAGQHQVAMSGIIRVDKKTRDLKEEVQGIQDTLTVTAASVAVEFDSSNSGLEVLETLLTGSEHAVFWKGKAHDGHFIVKIWREATTPAGLVQTNIARNSESGQLAEPIALKRLKKRIEAAVIDGRVPTVKLLTLAA